MKVSFRILCVFLCIVYLPATAFAAETPKFLRIVTTSPGGIWHTFGTHFAEKLKAAYPDISVSHSPGNSALNHSAVSQGKADIGLSYTPISIDSYLGKGEYKTTSPNARVIGTHFASYMHPVVRPGLGIKNIHDLQGKIVSVGKQSWANTKVVSQIIEMFGITEKTLIANGGQMQYLGWPDVDSAMQDRRLDAFMYFSSVPSPLLMRLAENPGIDLPPYTQEEVDKIVANLEPKGGFSQMQYPKNPYKNVKGDFPCPIMWSIVVVNKDLPDDLVYGITKILYENKDLRDFMGGGTSLSIDLATESLLPEVVPFHPGAKRYLQEKGGFKEPK